MVPGQDLPMVPGLGLLLPRLAMAQDLVPDLVQGLTVWREPPGLLHRLLVLAGHPMEMDHGQDHPVRQ